MKRPVGVFGIAMVVLAIATGCATPPSAQKLVPGSEIHIGEAAPLTNLNPGVSAPPLSEQAALDLAELTRPQFFVHDSSGAISANTSFGKVTRGTDNTVTYTLTGKAKWSDGVPVDAADLVVSWLAAVDPQVPGYASVLRRSSLALSDKISVLGNGVKVHFTQPVPDWQTALPVTAPAHLVGKLAFPNANLTDAAAEKLITDEALSPGTTANSGLLAAAYSTAFATSTNGTVANQVDSHLLLSAGPYYLDSATPSKAVLLANQDYSAGPKPTVAKVVFHFFGSGDELLSAAQAKQVDLAAPVATSGTDLAKAQSTAKAAGYSVRAGGSGRNEVVLLNFGSGSAFNPETWANNVKQLSAARHGAFKFFPRSGVWNVLVGTAGITKTNSLAFDTADSNYADSVAKNGTIDYAFQDAEASVEEWQAALFQHTIELRVLFDANSTRGQLEFTQLSRLGKLGGFKVQNVSSDNPDAVLASGQWDMYITSQGQLGLGGSSLATAIGALSGFQNPAVTKLVAKVAAAPDEPLDPADAKTLDQLLVKNYYGLPLFQLDGLVIWSSKLAHFSGNPANTSLTWGYSNWSVSASGK